MNKILLLISISLFLSNASAQNNKNSNTIKIIELLKKSLLKSDIDSGIFIQGISLLNNSKVDSNDFQLVDNLSANFKTKKNINYYSILKTALIKILDRNNEPEKAIEYSKKLISEIDNSNDRKLYPLRQSILFDIRIPYRKGDFVAGFEYYTKKLKQYIQSKDSSEVFICYFVLSYYYDRKGLSELSIYCLKKSILYISNDLSIVLSAGNSKPLKSNDALVNQYACIGGVYMNKNSYSESLKNSRFALKNCQVNSKTYWDSSNIAYTLMNIANVKLHLNETDSVLNFLTYALKIATLTQEVESQAFIYQTIGYYYYKINKLDSAEISLNNCKQLIKEHNILASSISGYLFPNYYLGLVYFNEKKYKQAEEAIKAEIPKLEYITECLLMEYKLLSDIYINQGDNKNGLVALQIYISIQHHLIEDERENRAVSFEMEKKMNEAENTISNLESQKEIATISRNYIIGIACLTFVIAIIIYSRYRLKQKTNAQLSKTLQELKDTQQQLLQSEKLAAFGAVATRIAHEIQNPLNFVTNFSQLSEELVTDIISAKNDEEKNESAKLLIDNLQKINHHGKRADSIVKQLFEHTKAGTAHEYFEEENI